MDIHLNSQKRIHYSAILYCLRSEKTPLLSSVVSTKCVLGKDPRKPAFLPTCMFIAKNQNISLPLPGTGSKRKYAVNSGAGNML